MQTTHVRGGARGAPIFALMLVEAFRILSPVNYLRVAGSNLISEDLFAREAQSWHALMEQKRFDWISKVVPSDRGITT